MTICGGLGAETYPDPRWRQIGYFPGWAIVVQGNEASAWLVAAFSEDGQGLCIPCFGDLTRTVQISAPRALSSIVRCRRRQHDAQKLGADAGEIARRPDLDAVPGGAVLAEINLAHCSCENRDAGRWRSEHTSCRWP